MFATTETFTSGKLKLADGRVVGEVRSGNTVILTEPSPHPKADEGGEYRWITTGADHRDYVGLLDGIEFDVRHSSSQRDSPRRRG